MQEVENFNPTPPARGSVRYAGGSEGGVSRKTPAKIKKSVEKTLDNITFDMYNEAVVINMRGREILKEIMASKSLSNAELAKRLSVSNATIWERLNNKNVKDIPVSLLTTMLRAMDYKVIIVPANTRLPDGGYEAEQVVRYFLDPVRPARNRILPGSSRLPVRSSIFLTRMCTAIRSREAALTILGAVAEQERKKTKQRQAEGIAAMPVVDGKRVCQ